MQRVHSATFEQQAETTQEAFTDAGFSVERVGESTILYEREVSDDVLEASRSFSRKRTIGFKSKDISGHECLVGK